MNVHVKTGDTVVILSGKDKGKKGKVLAVSPKEGKVIVEGCNMIKKHVKPRRMVEHKSSPLQKQRLWRNILIRRRKHGKA